MSYKPRSWQEIVDDLNARLRSPPQPSKSLPAAVADLASGQRLLLEGIHMLSRQDVMLAGQLEAVANAVTVLMGGTPPSQEPPTKPTLNS